MPVERQTLRLAGCTPEPMMHYLKALGVLRLVSEQADSSACGWWLGDVFHLASVLDRDALVNFFLNQYSSTPIVAPWNGGSGFYEGDKRDSLDAIRGAESDRFADYRDSIEDILGWAELPPTSVAVGLMLQRVEESAMGKKGKSRDQFLVPVEETRRALRQAADWLDADEVLRLTVEELDKLRVEVKSATPQQKARNEQIARILRPAKKVRTKFKSLYRAVGKKQIVVACRDRLGDRAVEWLDAVAVVDTANQLSFPPILSSGGNEGRLDYTNAFMSSLSRMLLMDTAKRTSAGLLEGALYGSPAFDLQVAAAGQHFPGRAGGFNQGAEIETKDVPVNDWDFILAMEGTIAWGGSVSRRYGVSGKSLMVSPFTVRARAVGYESSTPKDEKIARAEIWAPLWMRPTPYPELKVFLAEGRAEIGRRQAGHGSEFAEAVASLGVDRGVSEFVRFTLQKRRGESYITLPAGRFPVRERRESDLVRELHPLLGQLDALLRRFPKQTPPARFQSCRRGIDEAIYGLLLHGGTARMKAVVSAIGKMEQLLAQRDLSKEPKLSRPLRGLHPRWVAAADDGSVEVRLAAALASIEATGKVGAIRANLAPIDPTKPWSWASRSQQQSWRGNSLCARLVSVLERRLTDAARLKCPANPFLAGLWVRPEDAASLIAGPVDEDLLQDLLFGFTWIRWEDREAVRVLTKDLEWHRPVSGRILPRAWCLLKLLFWPKNLPLRREGVTISVRPEPAIVPLLLANRIGEACNIAQRRLTAAGLSPVRAVFPDGLDGVRIAAALLIPVRPFFSFAGKVIEMKES